MVRIMLIAVVVLTAVTKAMADTGFYECTTKARFEIGSDGFPKDSWPIPQLLLFDVQSGLLITKYEIGGVGAATREYLTVIGRLLPGQQPVRSDVTAYDKIVNPSGERNSNVLWSFSIKFGSAEGNGTFLLVKRQTVTTGICEEK